jgi:hypothetical protein
MRHQLDFFRNKLKPDSGIDWETPIVHLIPRMPFTVTPVTNKVPITFGQVKIQIYINIYNTRISYPRAIIIILLSMADIKACFLLEGSMRI